MVSLISTGPAGFVISGDGGKAAEKVDARQLVGRLARGARQQDSISDGNSSPRVP